MVTALLKKMKRGLEQLADAAENGGDTREPISQIRSSYNEIIDKLKTKSYIKKKNGSMIPFDEKTSEKVRREFNEDGDDIVVVQPEFPLKERMAMHSIKNSLLNASGLTDETLIKSYGIETETVRYTAKRIGELLERLDKPFHAERVSLKEIIKEHVFNTDIKVSFEPDTAEHVEGDRYLIKGLVDNLFNNSKQNLKENKDKLKELKISVTLKDLGEKIELVHEDTGTGFPKGFDPLHSQTTRADRGGTGQGIREIMDVAKLHRMQVNFENRPEGGARVTIHIPKKHKALEEHGKLV
jgi:signal transduction histidine kinase